MLALGVYNKVIEVKKEETVSESKSETEVEEVPSSESVIEEEIIEIIIIPDEDLSDKTVVANSTWQDLKNVAMRPKYRYESWFICLKPEEKQLVVRLRKFQASKGGLEALLINPEDAKIFGI